MTGKPSSAPPLAIAGAELTIDLGALADNWRYVRSLARQAEAGAVVKANGYGLGIETVGKTLWAAGCRSFFVALPDEGVRLRGVVPDARIFVLNGLFPSATETYADERLIPILGSMSEIEDWLAAREANPAAERAAIHVDTGMNRIGFSVAEFRDLAAQSELISALDPQLVMSHYACADEPNHPLNAEQRRDFAQVRHLLAEVPASFANSAAVLSESGHCYDLIRPGVCLYGGRPHPTNSGQIKDVVTLNARIIQVRQVERGEPISYGATYRAPSRRQVATLSIGYADGVHRIAGWSDEVAGHVCYVGDYPAPIVGRVTMDLIMVDVTDVPVDLVHRNAWVEVFGPKASIQSGAEKYRSIDYEVLTSLGARYARRYVNHPQ